MEAGMEISDTSTNHFTRRKSKGAIPLSSDPFRECVKISALSNPRHSILAPARRCACISTSNLV